MEDRTVTRHPGGRVLEERDSLSSDQLLYILAYESLADREKKWGAILADQERLAKFAEIEKNGPLVRRLTAQILRPIPYSPMQ